MNEPLYSEHPAMFKNDPFSFVLAVILIAAFGLGLIILLFWYLQTKASKLTIYENEILFEKGLLSKERSEMSISSVRAVKVKQSFFNRIFGVGKVEIYTTGDLPEIVAAGFSEPNKVRELLKAGQNNNRQPA